MVRGARAGRVHWDAAVAQLRQLPAHVPVVVYMSGHVPAADVGFEFPGDGHHLDLGELRRTLQDLPAPRVALLLDCCHAAGVLPHGRARRNNKLFVLASSAVGERSYAWTGIGHSNMTAQLLPLLDDRADPCPTLDLDRVADRVCRDLRSHWDPQHPQIRKLAESFQLPYQ